MIAESGIFMMTLKKIPYQQTLDYLYTQLPMFQREGNTAFKKDLTNIRLLCEALGNPQDQFRSIHIAGTNGKGSTAHLLSAVFQASGYQTGLYTSPHYVDFRERIKIDGQLMAESFVVEFVADHKDLFERVRPSFFEITVAMAFSYFAQQKVDVAIIETGLGGRLDSTNIISPELSIITNISFDHQQFLGNTLPAIASEKAGIIKANTPVVIGERHPQTEQVFIDKANSVNAPIYFAKDEIRIRFIAEKDGVMEFKTWRKKSKRLTLKVGLSGEFQQLNVHTVLTTLFYITETNQFSKIKFSTIQEGLLNVRKLTRFIGRWMILSDDPLTICDSAHNEGGLKIVLKMIDDLTVDQIHFVFGTVKDKDHEKVFNLLPKTARYYFAKANIPRGLAAEDLRDTAADYGLEGDAYDSVAVAFRVAQRNAGKRDLVFVGGSIFVVAEVLDIEI